MNIDNGNRQMLVYVSGAYRAKPWPRWLTMLLYPLWIAYRDIRIALNILAARKVAIKYWRDGYTVVCPHSNTAFFDGTCPDDVWLAGDLIILERCDIIVMMKGYEQSEGAMEELRHAEACGLEIRYE